MDGKMHGKGSFLYPNGNKYGKETVHSNFESLLLIKIFIYMMLY